MPSDSSHYENLPPGWAATKLEDLFDIVGGGTPATGNATFWGEGIPWFSSADIGDDGTIRPRRLVTKLGIEKSAANVAPAKSVIVVTRVGLGKVAVLEREMCFSQDNQALIPKFGEAVYAGYIYYFMLYVMRELKHRGRGTTISGLTKKQLSEIHFRIPPLSEQKRIVAAVETAYQELDAVIDCVS